MICRKNKYRARSENSNRSACDNNSIYDKLYSDHVTRTTRMDQNIEKLKNIGFLSLSNDRDNRERFFVPKINEKSRKITTKNLK